MRAGRYVMTAPGDTRSSPADQHVECSSAPTGVVAASSL